MKSSIILLAVAVLLSIANSQGWAIETEGSPVQVKLLRMQRGKPPLQFYHCQVTIENRSNKPYWVVLPEDISITLLPNKRRAKHLRIPAPPDDETIFEGKGYKTIKGRVVAVHAFVKPALNAYHIPAMGRIVFKKLPFEAWSKVKSVNVILARDILVNGKTPLDRWLPFPTLSPVKAIVLAERDWENLNWDKAKNRKRSDFPKEIIKFIELKNLYSYEVPLKH